MHLKRNLNDYIKRYSKSILCNSSVTSDKDEEKIVIKGNHLEMISISYQKLTANMMTGENLKHCQEGEAGKPVTRPPPSQGEALGEN